MRTVLSNQTQIRKGTTRVKRALQNEQRSFESVFCATYVERVRSGSFSKGAAQIDACETVPSPYLAVVGAYT
ncbi:hypothetical protein GCM10025859_32440 [Alicyclobacillus fastidiosus]|nr:hypothetical protein GCM10025859_32440 [Alicyclobacillus fastidiosus]